MAKKKAVLYIDGGICSQIYFFSLGMFFASKGYAVEYDFRWFEECGKDMDGKFDRSFAIDKAFPKLKFKIASKFTVWLYRHFFRRKWTENNMPCHLYVDGYSDLRTSSFFEYKDVFINNFNPLDVDLIPDLIKKMRDTDSCAVHVRRGDLARYNPVYGVPPTADKFVLAIKYVLEQRPDSVFYFFSDEIDFVKKDILSLLPKYIKYEICDKNGSDKGYLDLYLISQAKSIIASQGSFGRMARHLSAREDLLFVNVKDF